MVKNPSAVWGDLGSISRLGRSPGEGHGQPTPVFLPGESHRQRRLADYSPWGCNKSDTTERLSTAQNRRNIRADNRAIKEMRD